MCVCVCVSINKHIEVHETGCGRHGARSSHALFSLDVCLRVCGPSVYAWQMMQGVSISDDFSHTFLQSVVKFYVKMKVFNGRRAHARQTWKHKDALIRSPFSKQHVKGHVPL